MVQLVLLPPHDLCFSNPEWIILLVLAYPGCPRKKAVKWHVSAVFVDCKYDHSIMVFALLVPEQNNGDMAEVIFREGCSSCPPVSKH